MNTNEIFPNTEISKQLRKNFTAIQRIYNSTNDIRKFAEEKNALINQNINDKIFSYQNQLNVKMYLSSFPKLSNITNKLNKDMFLNNTLSATRCFASNWRLTLIELGKSDFRISVMGQEIENYVNQLLKEETDDSQNQLETSYNKIFSEISIYQQNKNTYRTEINELKETVTTLTKKVIQIEEDTNDKNLTNDKKKHAFKKRSICICWFFLFCL